RHHHRRPGQRDSDGQSAGQITGITTKLIGLCLHWSPIFVFIARPARMLYNRHNERAFETA
ncbi:MAG TPA: hypothetical protein VMB24_04800, partial [Dehalococcoidales bacterium]|nr:hypothetical protein [Dehalococcoidales bacterium]